MAIPESTNWEILEAAAAGSEEQLARFAERYESTVRSQMEKRWRGRPLVVSVDDAVQDVFVECLKTEGVLQKVAKSRPGGFRAYLQQVVTNVAKRYEERTAKQRKRDAKSVDPQKHALPQTSLSVVMDRETARRLVRDAAEIQTKRAAGVSESAVLRVELLRLKFHENLPIREIAKRWKMDPAKVHHQYAKARQEFRKALAKVMGDKYGGTEEEIEERCERVLDLLR